MSSVAAMWHHLISLCLLANLALCGPVQAQADQSQFDLRLGSITVARLFLAANDDGRGYAVAGRAESTGMVSLFRALRLDMSARGTWNGTRPQPQSYVEDIDTGRRASAVTMRWQSGRPVVDASTGLDPTLAAAADGTTGTVDPLSAVYTVARPRSAEELCDWQLGVFDGQRRSQLTLLIAEGRENAIICRGNYTRLAGFAPHEMAERTEFPFTVTYIPGEDGLWLLHQIDLQSIYGRVRINRAEP
ncbi:MAG: DUF3108 domain-containing protein [Pseudomonadota bacterium]